MDDSQSKLISEIKIEKEDLRRLYSILNKYNLKETEEILKKEGQINDNLIEDIKKESSCGIIGNLADQYARLYEFIDSSMKIHKDELKTLLYPLFVHIYLHLIQNNQSEQAAYFYELFEKCQESVYRNDMTTISEMSKRGIDPNNPVIEVFLSNEFTVRICKSSYNYMKRSFIEEKLMTEIGNFIEEKIRMEIYDGLPRKDTEINSRRGAIFGESSNEKNEKPILYGNIKDMQLEGIIRRRTDIPNELAEDIAKKRKLKKDSPTKLPLMRSHGCGKLDNNSPEFGRIPLPILSSDHKQQVRQIYDEINSMPPLRRKRRLFNEDIGRGDNILPLEGDTIDKNKFLRDGIPLNSVMYTLGNLPSQCCTTVFNEDCSRLAAGLSNGTIHVRCLNDSGLSVLKSSDDLNQLIMTGTGPTATGTGSNSAFMMDSNNTGNKSMFVSTGTNVKDLHGHSEGVFGLSWSTDNTLLASTSFDGTLRLWSTLTWSCLCKFQDGGGTSPLWCVDIAPIYGHYLVTGGHDRCVNLYSTDCMRPIRKFLGDCYGPVNCVRFHNNCNYIATGSTDRVVRLFDMRSGAQVRSFTGHKGRVNCVEFSEDGRFMISGGDRGSVCIWDLSRSSSDSSAALLDNLHITGGQDLTGGPINSLALCRDGAVLSVGRQAGQVDIWNLTKVLKMNMQSGADLESPPGRNNALDGIIDILYTKKTPIMNLRFNRRNMLCCAGVYNQI